MIDKPDDDQIPEMRVNEAGPAKDVQTASADTTPDAQTLVPAETPAPMTEPAPTARSAGNEPAAVGEPASAAAEPVSETDFSFELTRFRQSFEEIQAEFIGEPRAAVDKAETLIDGLMKSLQDQLQRVRSNVTTDTDTEQLRVAMLGYRELFDSLGGHRAA